MSAGRAYAAVMRRFVFSAFFAVTSPREGLRCRVVYCINRKERKERKDCGGTMAAAARARP